MSCNNNNSITIDLALDHSDYYTHVGSVFLLLVEFCLIADYVVRHVLAQLVSRHDLAAGYFGLRLRPDGAKMG